MPNWKFYDKAADRLASGSFSDGEWAHEWNAAWLSPGYTFQADIPYFDLEGHTQTGEFGGTPYPDAVNPAFWIPKYPNNHPDVFKRGTPIPQRFYIPGRNTVNDLEISPYAPEHILTHHSLFGDNHLWHDTWNNVLRWRSPNIIWVMPADLTPVQHLIWASKLIGEPVMLLSLDAPLSPGTYELDWAGGLYGVEEDRFGIVMEIVG
jgi:hypothetical protein